MPLRRYQAVTSCTPTATVSKRYPSGRFTTPHPQRSNPHSGEAAARPRTRSLAAPPAHLPRFPPLEVFGSPALAPVYVGKPVVYGPASENLHMSARGDPAGSLDYVRFAPVCD